MRYLKVAEIQTVIQLKIILVFVFLFLGFSFKTHRQTLDEKLITYTVDCKKQQLAFYWKDDRGNKIKSIAGLIAYTQSKNKKLLFAMNAGMYMEDNTPLGLYIEEGKELRHLNKRTGKGNFYVLPNGVLCITKNKQAAICATNDFKNKNIEFATQSGPMLLKDGAINANFTEGSQNLNIRNGVGVLPDGTLLFAMSKTGINFYDFALYFKNKGCKNALYLDGFVSRCYLPEKNWKQYDGNFGAMIGVTE